MTDSGMNVPPPPQYPAQYAKTSGLAIGSLVLAVLGLLLLPCAPLLAIPAIITGHIAYSRINRSGGAEGGQGVAVAGFVVGYVGLGIWVLLGPIMAAILLPALSRAREAANRASCQNNLKQVGVMLKMYQGEHDGAYPNSLSELYPTYMTDPNVLVCPSSEEQPGDPAEIDSWSSYEYTPPEPNANDAMTPVCSDRDNEFHVPDGRNVLYADGHVEFLKEVFLQGP